MREKWTPVIILCAMMVAAFVRVNAQQKAALLTEREKAFVRQKSLSREFQDRQSIVQLGQDRDIVTLQTPYAWLVEVKTGRVTVRPSKIPGETVIEILKADPAPKTQRFATPAKDPVGRQIQRSAVLVTLRANPKVPQIVFVPSQVFIPAGQTSATFLVQTAHSPYPIDGKITATYRGVSKQTTLRVNP